MGREIRKVPKGWEHPRKAGRYIPLLDSDFESAHREWTQGRALWLKGKHPDQREGVSWEDWTGQEPDPEEYRPEWSDEERTCFQVYETVSEGTPVSPVFETLEEMREWIIGQGYSPEAAAAFVRDGWVPSLVMTGGRLYKDIETASLSNAKKGAGPS